MITAGTIKVNAKATAFSSKSFSFGSQHSLDTMVGAVEVQSPGCYTVVRVSCDSMLVDTKSTSSFEAEDVFHEGPLFTLVKVLAM